MQLVFRGGRVRALHFDEQAIIGKYPDDLIMVVSEAPATDADGVLIEEQPPSFATETGMIWDGAAWVLPQSAIDYWTARAARADMAYQRLAQFDTVIASIKTVSDGRAYAAAQMPGVAAEIVDQVGNLYFAVANLARLVAVNRDALFPPDE